MNVLYRDPHAFVAKTFDQAVMKLEKLIEIGSGTDTWGPNILSATKDLEPQYEEQFIRYLANPSGCAGNFVMKNQISNAEQDKLKVTHPHVDFDKPQRTTVVKTQGNVQYLVVESDNESDDEKLPN